ncbi:zinc transport system permease protein [Geotoga petraea]|uniref:Metal ABC transporter permease n=2 Tax=Geotoga petraea TaxID=28234 RepID=A0A1G6L1H6_9BACT|nr:metal ABC transporter permease [Geotoga petraea]TGG89333.1 metal ABC transporter permease [Geotoga petraea]SDC37053.1 zinc transport system permease protein [Geotoga petraea]
MIEILSYQFMLYALIASILSGLSCSILSNYIVLRKMEFISDGAAHTAFGGIAVAIFFGWNMNLVSIITGILFAVFIYFVGKKGKISENSLIGMLFPLSMALGVIIMNLKPGYTPEIESYLFGDILMVNLTDIITLGIILLSVIFFITIFNKELKYFSYNERMAKIYGVPTELIRFLFLIAVALVVVTSVKIIGIILVTSMLITPGVIAKLWAKSINQMVIISSIFGLLSSFLGIYFSYYLDIPSGPSIVVLLFIFFLINYFLKKLIKA